ncbi:MAG: hypothetical protein LBK76_10645, partial [Verrucomicrobiales bacterium]|nr:hypothetical protein [Verrucomicrobiales bacterium]
MKNNNILNWAALLLTISGMAATSLSAAPKVVNTDQSGVPDIGGVYESVSNTAALYVYSPGASYSGSDTTLSSTLSGNNIGRLGAYINNRASIYLSGGSISTSGTNGVGLYLNGTSSGTARDLNVTSSGDGTIRPVLVNNSSTLFLSSSTLTINGSGQGIFISAVSAAILDNIQITAVDGSGIGVTATSSLIASDLHLNVSGTAVQNGLTVSNGATATVSGLTIIKGNGGGAGVSANNAQVTLTDVDITVTSGSEASGLAVGNTAVLTATNVRIAVTGGAHNEGLRFGSDGAATMTLTNADITVDSPDSQVIYLASSSTIGADEHHTLVINGGRLSAAQGTVI